jgi:ribosomal protein L37AE/L43A
LALTVLATVTAAALGIVTNYATEHVPGWLKERPAVTWILLATLVILAAWLAVRLADKSETGQDAPRRRWLILHHRDARLVHCLACGKELFGTLKAGESGAWRCAKCGRTSVASVDSTARVTIETPGYGKVRYTQRVTLFGLLTKVYRSEVLEQAKPAPDTYRDLNDPGATVITQAVDGMFEREFRAAFIRGLLRDRWKRVAGWSAIGSFLVPWGQVDSPTQFAWRVALGFCICASFGVGMLWLAGRRTIRKWMSSREALYCWLQRPEGIALAVVMGPTPWYFEALRILGGREAQKLGVELMRDICRYADRNNLTLSMNASDPDWLIEELHFEQAPEQRRRGYTTLIRPPSGSRGRAKVDRRERRRARGRR